MSARDAILARLRASTIAQAPALPDVSSWYAAQRRDESQEQRAARLRAAMQAVKTEVHDTTHSDWAELLLRLAAAKGVRQLLIGSDTAHGSELEARHRQRGSTQSAALALRRYTQPIDAWRQELFDDIDASFTLARSAIAETGSLILWPDAREPRLLSLVPAIHFVLLDVATIHADMHSAFSAEGWARGMPTNALLISGPSKTADIQQTLAYGAHGPRELVLLLRHGAEAAP
ncbi:MAG: lactate utilization protein [Betaproteobacteria bacterium]